MSSSRYCFTWNNYNSDAIAAVEKFYEERCQYLIYGKEISASGTPHLQGFFTTKKSNRIPSLRKSGMQCHLEVTKGTSIQAIAYCKKDEDFVEFGVPPTPGKRSDLSTFCSALKAGSSISVAAAENPETFVRYSRGLRELALIYQKAYNHDTVRGHWYVGNPGTGKSAWARTENAFYLKAQNKWFDGYANEAVIILDDLDTAALGHHLKIWADRYACNGETKGGTVALRHKKFIVTSNFTIDGLFSESPEICKALKRRFTVRNFDLFPYYPVGKESIWTPCTPESVHEDDVSVLTDIPSNPN